MRRALNENRTVQIAVLGVAAIALVVVLYAMVLSGDRTPSTPPEAAAPSTASAAGAVPTGAAPVPAAPESPTESVAAEDLRPSKGLPGEVLTALGNEKVVALLVADPEAISDRRLSEYVRRLSRRDEVVAFEVAVDEIARYSRITSGVSVGRTPALVVVSSRDPGSTPSASVSYGFRDAKSVEVALEDALYEGGTRSASP